MNPIFEQGKGNGIGHSLDSFLKRFIEICEKSKSFNKKKTFAFILYNFEDYKLKKILKNDGIFTKLDRLTGDSLDIFYLNSKDSSILEGFNKIILHAFEFSEELNLPCFIFFDVNNGEVEDVFCEEIDINNILLGFNEIVNILHNHINKETKTVESIDLFPKTRRIFNNLTEKIAISVIADRIKEFFPNIHFH